MLCWPHTRKTHAFVLILQAVGRFAFLHHTVQTSLGCMSAPTTPVLEALYSNGCLWLHDYPKAWDIHSSRITYQKGNYFLDKLHLYFLVFAPDTPVWWMLRLHQGLWVAAKADAPGYWHLESKGEQMPDKYYRESNDVYLFRRQEPCREPRRILGELQFDLRYKSMRCLQGTLSPGPCHHVKISVFSLNLSTSWLLPGQL